MTERPALSFGQIWTMCFGFLGIQFGFALQNANVSRIFQTLGASTDALPGLWMAAPLTGLIVQPLIGHCSDRTWTQLGRRRPYFLAGAVLAAIALLAMPMAAALWAAVALLWLLDASINVSMEPFRAFVGDQLPVVQRPTGYAMQSFFIGIGSVVAGVMPWVLAKAGVGNVAAAGHVPDTVRWSFQIGAAVLLGAIGWTVLRTREYPPAMLAAFDPPPRATGGDLRARPSASQAWPWLGAGALIGVLVASVGLDRQLYLLGALPFAYGAAQLASRTLSPDGVVVTVLGDLRRMPPAMRMLAPVQFFAWFALFALWIYTTAAVAQVHYHSTDPASDAYNAGANWVGVLFAAYNGFAALAAVVIPRMVRRWGLRVSHLLNLLLGAAGFASIALIHDPRWLLASMAGVGFAWASTLALPYAMLADALPAAKMGVYMGIFNFFIVIPQLVATSVLGPLVAHVFHGHAMGALLVGAASLVVAGLCTLRVKVPG